MAMSAENPAVLAGRLEELQRENAQLREDLRRAAAARTVKEGALLEAAQEKEATARLAHQVAVEERATRAAVAVQGSSIGMSIVLHVLSFFLLLVLTIGLFVWLPGELQARTGARTTVAPPGATMVIPGR